MEKNKKIYSSLELKSGTIAKNLGTWINSGIFRLKGKEEFTKKI